MNFKTHDLLSFSTHGVYRVDNIDSMQAGSAMNDYYILSKLNSHMNHKTYVAVKSAKKDGLRTLITAEELKNLKSNFCDMQIIPVDRKLNCVQKVESLTRIILSEGFLGNLKAYKASYIDLSLNKKEDKKVKEFHLKIKKAMIEELSISQNISLTDAEISLNEIIDLRHLS